MSRNMLSITLFYINNNNKRQKSLKTLESDSFFIITCRGLFGIGSYIIYIIPLLEIAGK